MRAPLMTIAFMLSLGFVTRYGGTDATLGLAFTHTGVLYPFFAAMLGWLGVALTGSDTSSNVLFGSLQKITAQQLGLNPILITTANTTGGVMGKMIDAQSIVVATAATNQHGQEGRILRFVFWHSVALAAIMGIIVMLQAYVFPWMVPASHERRPFLAALRRIAGDDAVFSEPLELLTYECDALTHLRADARRGRAARRRRREVQADRAAVRAREGSVRRRAATAPACRAARCRSPGGVVIALSRLNRVARRRHPEPARHRRAGRDQPRDHAAGRAVRLLLRARSVEPAGLLDRRQRRRELRRRALPEVRLHRAPRARASRRCCPTASSCTSAARSPTRRARICSACSSAREGTLAIVTKVDGPDPAQARSRADAARGLRHASTPPAPRCRRSSAPASSRRRSR